MQHKICRLVCNINSIFTLSKSFSVTECFKLRVSEYHELVIFKIKYGCIWGKTFLKYLQILNICLYMSIQPTILPYTEKSIYNSTGNEQDARIRTIVRQVQCCHTDNVSLN